MRYGQAGGRCHRCGIFQQLSVEINLQDGLALRLCRCYFQFVFNNRYLL